MKSDAAGLMVLAWTFSEIVRYPYLMISTADSAPAWLTWLRYSAFLVLYPIGFYGEMRCIWDAIPYIREAKIGVVRMPNVRSACRDPSVIPA